MKLILSVTAVCLLGLICCCNDDAPAKKITFKLSVQTFNPVSENFQPSTAELEVVSAEKLLRSQSVPAAVTTIKVNEKNSYTLTISKAGYIPVTREFTRDELRAYSDQAFYVRLYAVGTASDLAVYYPFSGNLADASGHYAAGVNSGALPVADQYGNFNSAYSFDGFTQYITMGNILDDITYPFTVAVWVKPEDHTGRPYNTIFTSQDNSPLYNGFEIHISNGTSIGFQIGDGRGENSGAYGRFTLAPVENRTGLWTHVAAVVTGNDDIRMFLNGVEVSGSYAGYTTFPINSNFPDDVARMGRWTANGVTYYYTGAADEFRVWKRALTPVQIKAAM